MVAPATARMVGMATNILPGEATREGGHTGDETIRESGGFAQAGGMEKGNGIYSSSSGGS